MTGEQLDLFAEDTERPFHLIACCAYCGNTLDAVPVEGGAGARWYAASLWCYLAQLEHNRAVHPEKVPAYHRRDEDAA